MKTLHHFIGGGAVAGTSGRTADITDPSSGIGKASSPPKFQSYLDSAGCRLYGFQTTSTPLTGIRNRFWAITVNPQQEKNR